MNFEYDMQELLSYETNMTSKQYKKFKEAYKLTNLWQGQHTFNHILLNVCRVLNGDFTYLTVDRLKNIIITINSIYKKDN